MPTIQTFPYRDYKAIKNPQLPGGSPNMQLSSYEPYGGVWASAAPLLIAPNEDDTYTIKGSLMSPLLETCCKIKANPLVLQFFDVSDDTTTDIATEGTTTGFTVTRTSSTHVDFQFTWDPGATVVVQGDYFQLAYETECDSGLVRVGFVLTETLAYPTSMVSAGCVALFELCDINLCDWGCENAQLFLDNSALDPGSSSLLYIGSFTDKGRFISSVTGDSVGAKAMVDTSDNSVTVNTQPQPGSGCLASENLLLNVGGKLYSPSNGCGECPTFGDAITVDLSAEDDGTAWDGRSRRWAAS